MRNGGSDVMADARQECDPRSVPILGSTEQFALSFSIDIKYSLRSVDYTQEKSLLIHVIRVLR
jgi:hypothetical protein